VINTYVAEHCGTQELRRASHEQIECFRWKSLLLAEPMQRLTRARALRGAYAVG
jgi:hypothetical protein